MQQYVDIVVNVLNAGASGAPATGDPVILPFLLALFFVAGIILLFAGRVLVRTNVHGGGGILSLLKRPLFVFSRLCCARPLFSSPLRIHTPRLHPIR
ncbi:hypothetical protein AGMMS49983_02660 [Clostridia bacterium]|nr:hypothetical protein AGMMS49983_02660 [Clostridia bacterium]